ncbi:MAG TPA: DUF2892 domain-containing protein [Clostridiaceae bacterium]
MEDGTNIIKDVDEPTEEKLSDVLKISDKTEQNIENRLKELGCEWSSERVVTTAAASAIVASTILGYAFSKKWFCISGLVGLLMLTDGLKGDCVTTPLAEKMKFRKAYDITAEKETLAMLKTQDLV